MDWSQEILVREDNAYFDSRTSLAEVFEEGGKIQLMKVKNPDVRRVVDVEWTGPFGDSDSLERWRYVDPEHVANEKDGIFWVPWAGLQNVGGSRAVL